jgi:hypothetical protein
VDFNFTGADWVDGLQAQTGVNRAKSFLRLSLENHIIRPNYQVLTPSRQDANKDKKSLCGFARGNLCSTLVDAITLTLP